MTNRVRVAVALSAISLNFLSGLLLVMGMGDPINRQIIIFSLGACLVLTLFWLPLYIWFWRRHGRVFSPILFFPNPYLATWFGLMLACVTGGGCV